MSKWVWVFAVVIVLLTGCGPREMAAPPALTPESGPTVTPGAGPPAVVAGEVARYQAGIHSTLPDFTFVFTGEVLDAAGNLARVERLEVWQSGAPAPLQVEAGLDAETPLAYPEAFVIEDLNFDGYADLRLIAFLPAGANVPYLYWLFDPQQGLFVRNTQLEAITSPEVDVANQQLLSSWRAGAATYGADTWMWLNGAPVMVRQETREYLDADRYRLTLRELRAGELVVVEERVVDARPPDAPTPAPDPFAIVFAPGAVSTVVEGVFTGEPSHTYHLRAAEGQVMLLAVTPQARAAEFWVTVAVEGATVEPAAATGLSRWTRWLGLLPASGEYTLNVAGYDPQAAYRLDIVIVTPQPERIVFEAGAIGTTVFGQLAGPGLQIYSLRALAGQLLSLSATPDSGVLTAVVGADGLIFDRFYESGAAIQTRLPYDRDYLVIVASAAPAPVAYGLELEIVADLTAAMRDACPTSAVDLLAYVDPVGGTCFLYPPGFDVQDGGAGTVRLLGAYTRPSIEPLAPVLGIANLGAADGRTVDQVAQDIIDAAGAGAVVGELTVGGARALVVEGLPGILAAREVYLLHAETVYHLWLWPVDVPELSGVTGRLWNAVVPSLTFW